MIAFPKGIVVIEAKSIQFAGKDIIEIEHEEDFVWLIGSSQAVWKLKNSYYSISDSVAYVYNVPMGVKNGKQR